jgi:dolichol kinase
MTINTDNLGLYTIIINVLSCTLNCPYNYKLFSMVVMNFGDTS